MHTAFILCMYTAIEEQLIISNTNKVKQLKENIREIYFITKLTAKIMQLCRYIKAKLKSAVTLSMNFRKAFVYLAAFQIIQMHAVGNMLWYITVM